MAKSKNTMDFSSLEFDLDLDLTFGQDNTDDIEKEFIKAAKLNFDPVCFENALTAVDCIDYDKDYFALVSGKFVFGDFIEALVYRKQLSPVKMYITTLGMSEDNIDSIVNLTVLGAQKVNLIVSNYFVAMERRKLVPYMVKEFAGHNIDVGVLASHCKICIIESAKGNIMICGSANLSSSNNVEQFMILHDDHLIHFAEGILDNVMEQHTVIRGQTGETIFENNTNNTGRKAFERVKEAAANG
jgi:hypothetical protein